MFSYIFRWVMLIFSTLINKAYRELLMTYQELKNS